MTDRIKIICSKCVKPFGERASRLRNGYQVQCPNCSKLIIFDTSSDDPYVRRPLKAARDLRRAAEDAMVQARMAESAKLQRLEKERNAADGRVSFQASLLK